MAAAAGMVAVVALQVVGEVVEVVAAPTLLQMYTVPHLEQMMHPSMDTSSSWCPLHHRARQL